MPQRIQAPDGSLVEFPDGMSDDQISAAMQKEYGGPANPAVADPNDDTNAGFWKSAAHAIGLPTLDEAEQMAKAKQQKGLWGNLKDTLEDPATYGPVPAIVAGAVRGTQRGWEKGAPEIKEAWEGGGDVLPRAAEAVQGAAHIAAGVLAPVGGQAAETVGEQLSRHDESGKWTPNLRGAAGSAAGLVTPYLIGKTVGRTPSPSPEYISSLDHDLAVTARDHVARAAMNEQVGASNYIDQIDKQIDAANPNGAIDGQKVLSEFAPAKAKYLSPGTKAGSSMPPAIRRVISAAGDTEEFNPEHINDPSGNTQAVVDAFQKGNLDMSSPANQALIADLRQRGLLPEENRPWSFSQARQIKSDLLQDAYKNGGLTPKARAAEFALAKSISTEMESAADANGFGDHYRAANQRYSRYMKTFENPNSPVKQMMEGENSNEILGRLAGPDAELVRRMLAQVDEDGKRVYPAIDVDDLQKKAQIHRLAQAAKDPSLSSKVRRNLMTSALVMAGGMAIGHPYIGTMLAARTAREAVGDALLRREIEPAAADMNVPVKTDRLSVPAPQRGVVRTAASMVPTASAAARLTVPQMFTDAATAAQAAPGPYGKPTHIDKDNGQRIARTVNGRWIDVDTGKFLRNLEEVGK